MALVEWRLEVWEAQAVKGDVNLTHFRALRAYNSAKEAGNLGLRGSDFPLPCTRTEYSSSRWLYSSAASKAEQLITPRSHSRQSVKHAAALVYIKTRETLTHRRSMQAVGCAVQVVMKCLEYHLGFEDSTASESSEQLIYLIYDS